jgi:hypothetical protein
VSVVPATTCTGDVTVAPLAGEQIVTEGDAGFKVHCAAAGTAAARVRRIKPANNL